MDGMGCPYLTDRRMCPHATTRLGDETPCPNLDMDCSYVAELEAGKARAEELLESNTKLLRRYQKYEERLRDIEKYEIHPSWLTATKERFLKELKFMGALVSQFGKYQTAWVLLRERVSEERDSGHWTHAGGDQVLKKIVKWMKELEESHE